MCLFYTIVIHSLNTKMILPLRNKELYSAEFLTAQIHEQSSHLATVKHTDCA